MVDMLTRKAEAWAPELRHRQHMAHLFKESTWTVITHTRLQGSTHHNRSAKSGRVRPAGWRFMVRHVGRSEQQWSVWHCHLHVTPAVIASAAGSQWLWSGWRDLQRITVFISENPSDVCSHADLIAGDSQLNLKFHFGFLLPAVIAWNCSLSQKCFFSHVAEILSINLVMTYVPAFCQCW